MRVLDTQDRLCHFFSTHFRLIKHSPHYITEKSNFSFMSVLLSDLNIPRKKWLIYLQPVETLIRCHNMRHLISLFVSHPFGVSRLKLVKKYTGFSDFLFAFLQSRSLLKSVCSKRKELALTESSSLSLE